MRTLKEETLARIESYVKEYQQENGLSPSYRQIMHALHLQSISGVQRYVLALERSNRIVRTNLGNIEVPLRFKRGEVTQAPLVGQIACGQPTFAEENIEETFALPQALFGGVVLVLTIVTCGIYSIYWMYKAGEKVSLIKARRGQPTGNDAILYLILQLLGFGIINYCLIQNEINQTVTAQR